MPDFSDKKYDYANLVNKMLDKVSNDLDKREGSVLWNTIAPNAMVLSQIYDIMKENQNNQYADTANRGSLIRLCKTRGITPYPATASEISANFYSDMGTLAPYNPTSGDTFYVQDTGVVFQVTTQIEDGKWRLICNTPGEIGNTATGRLIPTRDMGNFAGAVVETILIYGEDEESTESLRERYTKSFDTKPYAGNRAFYREYTESIPGIGGSKIYRAYQGLAGHVGVCIIDSEGSAPSEELVRLVQDELDPVGFQGEGVGVAPIDHIVTVFAATSKTINISIDLICSGSTTWEDVKPAVEKAARDYLTSVALEWADESNLIIRGVKLQAAILEIPEVLDISSFTMNGQQGSIELEANEIPKLGTVTGTVA